MNSVEFASRYDYASLVTDHVPAMLAYWDKDLVCRFANAEYKDWFGKTAEELVDKMTLAELLGPDLFEKNKPYALNALEGIAQVFEREIPIKNKGTRHAIANYIPHQVDGKVHGFFVHVTDITPIKLLEFELSDSNAIVSKQNQVLLNFANMVSHNLKNHANALSGLSAILFQTNYSKEQEQVLQHLKLATDNFSSTLQNLSDIVKVQNQSKVIAEVLQLGEFVQRVLNTFKYELELCGGVVENKVAVNALVYANKAYLESILINLISNAIKYRDLDRKLVIEIKSAWVENVCQIQVTDNGRGIDLNAHGDKIFGLYKTFHQHPDANGVGLYISKYQAEQMGGGITVTSTPKVGSVFTVTLPTMGASWE